MRITPIVYHILNVNEKARANDQLLTCLVYEELGVNTMQKSFIGVMTDLSLPTFGSIARCRRKLQEKFENLRPADKVQRIRQEEKAKYIAFAKGEIEL